MARARRERGEDGAVVPFVAIVLVVLLLCAALATDIGLQRVARSDMQAVADTVALDLARELDGRDAATLQPLVTALAEASRDRNADVVGDQASMTVELGQLDDRGDFELVAGTGVPSAVRVTARTEVDFAFGGVTGVDDGAATRSAVGVAQLGACFRVGSYVARLDSTTGPLLDVLLSTLLGSGVSLTVADWNGLAAADVTLVELVEVGGLGVGTVEELLELDHLAVADLYVAVARVLAHDGALVAAELLEALEVTAGTPTIALADLLVASPSDRAALDARLNVLDLVTGAAYAAGRGRSLVVDALGVPGLVGATLHVTEAPQVGCGGPGTQASTAQVRLSVPVTVPGRTLTVPGVGSVRLDPTTVAVELDLGRALAELLDVTCGPAGAESLAVRLSPSVVGALSVTASMGVHARVGGPELDAGLLDLVLGLLGALDIPLGAPEITLDTTVRMSAGTLPSAYSTGLTLPLPGAYTTPVGSASGIVIGAPHASLGAGASISIRLPRVGKPPLVETRTAGPIFDGIVDPLLAEVVSGVLAPLLGVLQTDVVAPLSELLGLQLAGADVWALREPSCGGPRLRE